MKTLDTDHCIALLRGALDLSGLVPPEEELAVTAISVGELVDGAHKSQRVEENLSRLDVLLAALTVLPYGEPEPRYFGRLKAELQKSGETLSDPDFQITSSTLEGRAPLITHNTIHFERLEKRTSFRLEDWLE